MTTGTQLVKSGKGVDTPPCPVCGENRNTAFSFKRDGNSIFFCRACSLEFQFPQPSDAVLTSIYSSTYFLGSDDARSQQRQEILKRSTAKLYLDSIVPQVKVRNPRLLEIGCGSGDFLLEAQSRGFQAEGLEYSEHAANNANNRLGRTAVSVGSPEKECLPPNSYDVIGAFDVIEHLRNPKQSLEYLHAALRPNGVVAIVTPSLDSWSKRLLGRNWMEYKTEHLTYFSKKSLARLLTATGFTNIRFFPNYKTLSIDYIYRHFERFPVPVVTSVVRFFRRLLPAKIAYRPIRIVASGIMVTAEKK
jgi:2-polyprenyl-3-methyl-5-hydroxy-6-metoxy-1,4-benzoquinol methylase